MAIQHPRSSKKLKPLSATRNKIRKRLKEPGSKRLQSGRVHSPGRRLPDHSAGVTEGAAWRRSAAFDTNPGRLREVIHQSWSQRFHETNRNNNLDWKLVQQRGMKYATGFMQGAGIYTSLALAPLHHKAAAVVCAGPSSVALPVVLSQLEMLPLREVVLVLSNPTDGMYSLARSRKNTVIASFPDEIDPDIGRALGAKLTGADTVLFVDGEQAVDAQILARFLWECDKRVDIALNDLSPKMGLFHARSDSSRFREFLNASLNREDLRTNSLSALPFAVSRNALDTLGPTALSVPAKAHALAILRGLKIGAGGSANSRALHDLSNSDESWKKAAGDHAEAWKEAMAARGTRLQFTDTIRNRSVLGDGER